MTVIDAELPYALVDLVLSGVAAIMSAILMCLSAGYFAATLPPLVLAVWSKPNRYPNTNGKYSDICDYSFAKVLSQNISPATSS